MLQENPLRSKIDINQAIVQILIGDIIKKSLKLLAFLSNENILINSSVCRYAEIS